MSTCYGENLERDARRRMASLLIKSKNNNRRDAAKSKSDTSCRHEEGGAQDGERRSLSENGWNRRMDLTAYEVVVGRKRPNRSR